MNQMKEILDELFCGFTARKMFALLDALFIVLVIAAADSLSSFQLIVGFGVPIVLWHFFHLGRDFENDEKLQKLLEEDEEPEETDKSQEE